jgi:hypothetical protein
MIWNMDDHRTYALSASLRSTQLRRRRVAILRDRRRPLDRSLQMVNLAVSGQDAMRHKFPVQSVMLRRSFLRGSPASPPPIIRLARTNEEALRLYLCLLLLETLRANGQDVAPSHLDHLGLRPTWPGLLAYGSLSNRQHVLRFQRALACLERNRLVGLLPAGVKGRYREPVVYSEEANGRPWSPPVELDHPNIREMTYESVTSLLNLGRNNAVLLLPAEFFTKGWWLVLNAPEICTLLVMLDIRYQFNRRPTEQVFLPREHRLGTYWLSDEMYRAHRELTEFRLLDMVDPMGSARVRGRADPKQILMPLHFRVRRRSLARDAFSTVVGALEASPSAPHLAVWPS